MDWVIEGEKEWLHIVSQSDSAFGYLIITVDTNFVNERRNATLFLKAVGIDNIPINVSQSGYVNVEKIYPEDYKIVVSPNPVERDIHVSFNQAILGKTVFSLCDISGREVFRDELYAEESIFNIEALNHGVYLYSIYLEGRIIKHGMFLKK
jgi:hypothetical protein